VLIFDSGKLLYWMPDQVGHDSYSAYFWWLGIDVTPYFSLWGIAVSAYFTLLELM